MNACSRIVLVAVPLFFATSAWSGDFQTGLDAFNSADYDTALAEWHQLAA